MLDDIASPVRRALRVRADSAGPLPLQLGDAFLQLVSWPLFQALETVVDPGDLLAVTARVGSVEETACTRFADRRAHQREPKEFGGALLDPGDAASSLPWAGNWKPADLASATVPPKASMRSR
jgi:hypothetical protein